MIVTAKIEKLENGKLVLKPDVDISRFLAQKRPRRHHEEAHRREKALFADYHIYGIKLDRHLCKVLSLNQKPKGEVERGE